MKILLSPVGEQDPHGKPHPETQEKTPGSALAIFRLTQPDKVVLLPTRHDTNKDTFQNAEETQFWMQDERPQTLVEIRSQRMEAANDYEEAIRVYGTTFLSLAQEHPDAELLINASSGTPAIKLACLLAVAGGLNATPYYADDPTRSLRADPVRPINILFLRESALIQRICGLIRRGQFGLAQEPLEELSSEPFASPRRQWAGYWKRLCSALQCWDERDYDTGCGRMRTLQREWKDAPDALQEALKEQHKTLESLSKTVPSDGLLAWDLYFQAERMIVRDEKNKVAGGQLAGVIIYLGIALETAIFEYAERRYGIDTGAAQYSIGSAIRDLHTKNDATFTELWSRSIGYGTVGASYDRLRKRRNTITHCGEVAKIQDVEQTLTLAQHWLSALGCDMPANYPLSPDALARLASLFSANCGL